MQSRELVTNTISARGMGVVRAQPDSARIILEVVTRAKKPASATSNNTKRVTSVLKALKALGIQDSKIRTSGLQIEPNQEWDEEDKKNVLLGFRANNGITVETSLDLAGRAYEVAVEAGASANGQIGYLVVAHEKLRREAIALATRSALDEIRAMAKALEVTLSGSPRAEVMEESNFLGSSYEYGTLSHPLELTNILDLWSSRMVVIRRSVLVSHPIK